MDQSLEAGNSTSNGMSSYQTADLGALNRRLLKTRRLPTPHRHFRLG
ncbi:MAG: hypothetical protein RIS70_4117 [Planctomycetota bacterium]